jgi:hypothetical protein
MRWRNEHVLKMHWTFESGRDYGRGMMCVRCIRGAVALRRVAGDGERGSALRAGMIFDTPPLRRALQSASSALGLLIESEVVANYGALVSATIYRRKRVLKGAIAC